MFIFQGEIEMQKGKLIIQLCCKELCHCDVVSNSVFPDSCCRDLTTTCSSMIEHDVMMAMMMMMIIIICDLLYDDK